MSLRLKQNEIFQMMPVLGEVDGDGRIRRVSRQGHQGHSEYPHCPAQRDEKVCLRKGGGHHQASPGCLHEGTRAALSSEETFHTKEGRHSQEEEYVTAMIGCGDFGTFVSIRKQ